MGNGAIDGRMEVERKSFKENDEPLATIEDEIS